MLDPATIASPTARELVYLARNRADKWGGPSQWEVRAWRWLADADGEFGVVVRLQAERSATDTMVMLITTAGPWWLLPRAHPPMHSGLESVIRRAQAAAAADDTVQHWVAALLADPDQPKSGQR